MGLWASKQWPQWLDTLSENWYILDAWGPRGSRADHASSRTRACRPRIARPCGPSDTLLGPLDRAIAPGFGFVRALGEIFVLRR